MGTARSAHATSPSSPASPASVSSPAAGGASSGGSQSLTRISNYALRRASWTPAAAAASRLAAGSPGEQSDLGSKTSRRFSMLSPMFGKGKGGLDKLSVLKEEAKSATKKRRDIASRFADNILNPGQREGANPVPPRSPFDSPNIETDSQSTDTP
mmetsp:Transcript_34924/g.42103  ORF Transcript_34924/g.42103 Transcript_34924/m.42103 type:complete len:155 (+) Transcript_34924:109-573(+)